MKKILLFLFSFLSGVVLFIWIGKTVGWQEIKNSFLVFTGWQGVVIFLATLLIMLLGNWRWLEILKGEDVKVSFKSLFNSYLIGFAVMFLFPILFWGGEVLRGYVLKKNENISWTKSMSSIIIDRILEWTSNLIIIFFGISFFLLTINYPLAKLFLIFVPIFLCLAAITTYFYFKVFKKESVVEVFLRMFGTKRLGKESVIAKTEKEIFLFFKHKKNFLSRAIVLSFLKSSAVYFRNWLLILFLGKQISLISGLSILSFSYLTAVIPIPGALGSHEAFQTFVFSNLGLGASTATAFTMLVRAAELSFALLGMAILFKLGFSILKNNLLYRNFNNSDNEQDEDRS